MKKCEGGRSGIEQGRNCVEEGRNMKKEEDACVKKYFLELTRKKAVVDKPDTAKMTGLALDVQRPVEGMGWYDRLEGKQPSMFEERKKEGRGVKEEDESKKESYFKREERRVWKSNELYENRRRKRVRRKKEI
jgi:hypothetical protein